MAFRAKLDFKRVYWGVEEVAELLEDDVEVPKDCDLTHGHYIHDAASKAFVPLPKHLRKSTPDAPVGDRALFELLLSMQLAGTALPQYCKDWALWYETTVDVVGDASLLQGRFHAAVEGGA